MLNTLKRLIPPDLRHKAIHLLPASIRHRLVDEYIAKQIESLRAKRITLGEKWLESIPGHDQLEGKGKPEVLITDYWRTINLDGNAPKAYAESTIQWDTDWLKSQVDRLLPSKGTVLDFGCNAGRVLRCFMEAGYQGIGIDINQNAVELGLRTFPSLSKAKLLVGDDALGKVESADVIYTSGVLRHVAPEKIDGVLSEFARIAPRYIITLEDEASLSHLVFPHDYRKKLGALSYRLIQSDYAIDLRPSLDVGGIGTMFRVYAR